MVWKDFAGIHDAFRIDGIFDDRHEIHGISVFLTQIFDLACAHPMFARRCAIDRNRVFHHLLVDGGDLVEFCLARRIDGEDNMVVAVADMAENGGLSTLQLRSSSRVSRMQALSCDTGTQTSEDQPLAFARWETTA